MITVPYESATMYTLIAFGYTIVHITSNSMVKMVKEYGGAQ